MRDPPIPDFGLLFCRISNLPVRSNLSARSGKQNDLSSSAGSLQIVAGGDSFGSGSACRAAPTPSATMTARNQDGMPELVKRTLHLAVEVYPSEPDHASESEIGPATSASRCCRRRNWRW